MLGLVVPRVVLGLFVLRLFVRGLVVPAPADRVLPTRTDPVVRGTSALIGGPAGAGMAVGGARFWTPLRVVLAYLMAMLAVGWLQKAPCVLGSWQDGSQYLRMCYTDLVALYSARGLDEGAVPYLEGMFEYPVVTGAVAYLMALLVPGWVDPAREAAWYFGLTSLLLVAMAAIVVWALHELSGRRPWDAALLALAPVLALLAFVNWDLIAVAAAVGGVLLWARGHPTGSGVLLGLGVAAKLWPALVLAALVLLCLRTARWRPMLRSVAGAGGAWLAVNLPVLLADPSGWAEFYTLSRERVADWGTLWQLPSAVGGPLADAVQPYLGDHLNLVAGAATVLAVGAVVALVLLAPRRPRVGQVCLLLLAAFLIPGKVWSPQFALWVLPFAVLARPTWRMLLVWQSGVILYFVGIWTHLYDLSTGSARFPDLLYVAGTVARMAVLVVLAAVVVRDVLRPERDVVRAAGVDDPAGGPLDGAPDAPWRARLHLPGAGPGPPGRGGGAGVAAGDSRGATAGP